MTDAALFDREHIETLNGRLQVIVSPDHTFGTDAMLLAAFAMPKPRERACDLGAGCGIIPFYWLSRGHRSAAAVELQPAACDMMRRSAALSGASDRLTVIETDLRAEHPALPPGGFDLVTMNPPYTAAGHGIPSESAAGRAARHEETLTLPELAARAARLLNWGGRFCLCMRPDRLPETMRTFSDAGLEPKRLRLVSQCAGRAPWLFLLACRKGGRPGLTVEPELTLKTPGGADTEEMLRILGAYRKD